MVNRKAEINIPDEHLKEALHKVLNIPQGNVITQDDMLRLSNLNVSGLNIKNLEGIQYAKNLETLYIGTNPIESFTPVSNLTSLKFLEFAGTGASDVSWLTSIPTLETAFGLNNAITDLRVLKDSNFKMYFGGQNIKLQNNILGQDTELFLYTKNGTVPIIAWLQPGSYNENKLLWEQSGDNTLYWSHADDVCSISGAIHQHIADSL